MNNLNKYPPNYSRFLVDRGLGIVYNSIRKMKETERE